MTDKAFVDAAQPATLNNGGGKLTDYSTLQEAVMAWHRLPPEQTRRATIKIIGGPVYCRSMPMMPYFGVHCPRWCELTELPCETISSRLSEFYPA
jgi:hypothetical protein